MDQTAPFAVGDRVILDNGRNNDPYGITWVSLMDRMVGKEFTISEIRQAFWCDDCWICRLEEDSHNYNYSHLWLHSAQSFSNSNDELDKMFEELV